MSDPVASSLPVLPATPSPENEAHFAALAEGRLLVPHCETCDRVFWYPRLHCPLCGSSSVTWLEASGRGEVYSFTVVRRGDGEYASSPYVLAYVELEEGVRVLTNVVGLEDPAKLEIGQAVEAVFERPSGETAALRFRPVSR